MRQIKDDAVAAGDIATVEEENSFKWTSPEDITVAGKPDVVTMDPNGKTPIIIDAKTGSPSLRDQIQVLLYAYFYRLAGKAQSLPEGRLIYQNGDVQEVPSSWLDPTLIRRIDEALAAVAAESLDVAPTIENCRWCSLQRICPTAVKDFDGP